MHPFSPDASLDAQVLPSPNHGERRGIAQPDMLILHYTGMQDARAALQRLCAPGSEVSAHYLVFEDGGIVQCVSESRRAWHAGIASWAGTTDINSHSIGIEIANPGHDGGYPDFPKLQISAVIALCRDILARYPIPPRRVLAHSDVAPMRKRDPGEKFPWDTLHAAGIGHWVQPVAEAKGEVLDFGSRGPLVAALRANLKAYGYALEPGDDYDAATASTVQAFQRHFLQIRVDGAADAATRATLARLAETCDQSADV